MMSFAEDDRSAMTSPASVHEHNATLAVDGGGVGVPSAWRTGSLGLLAAVTSIVTVGGNLIVILSFVLERTIRQPSNYFVAPPAARRSFTGISCRRETRATRCVTLIVQLLHCVVGRQRPSHRSVTHPRPPSVSALYLGPSVPFS